MQDPAIKNRRLEIPIIALGHLFTAGGQTVVGDGVRDLYIGSLAHVTAGAFPAAIDYLALGHLHVPQKVSRRETMRYSGSPIPMGFGEAKQQKSVVIVDFSPKIKTRVETNNGELKEGISEDSCESAAQNKCLRLPVKIDVIPVPVFQKLERVKGDWDAISRRILELSAIDSHGWLEVIYDGEDVTGDLRERLDAAIAGTGMEILRVKNNRIVDRVLRQFDENETLDDLDENDVFERCLVAHEIPEDQRPELRHVYRETMQSLQEEDRSEL